jgi:rhodanese-related sulfurtransferase
MQPQELLRRMRSKNPLILVDVRTIFEFRKGHIPGAIHAQTWKILLRLDRIPPNRDAELVVTCEHGPRAKIVKAILGIFGYRNVTLLEGHMAAWRYTGRPQEK